MHTGVYHRSDSKAKDVVTIITCLRLTSWRPVALRLRREPHASLLCFAPDSEKVRVQSIIPFGARCSTDHTMMTCNEVDHLSEVTKCWRRGQL